MRHNTNRQGRKKGNVLIVTLIGVAVLTQAGGSLMVRTLTDNRFGEIRWQNLEMIYAAEGAMDAASVEFRQLLANNAIDVMTPRYPATGTLNTTYQPIDSDHLAVTATSVFDEVEAGQQILIDTDGVPVWVKNYILTTTVQHPLDATRQVTLRSSVTRRMVSAFHYGVFYDGDLEILPGPNMALRGRVHSNGDMYLGAGSHLWLDSDFVRTTGNVFLYRKNDNSNTVGNRVSIRVAGTATYEPMGNLDSRHPQWTTMSLARWQGAIQSGVHGVTTAASPSIGSIHPGGDYDAQASLKVVNGNLSLNGFTLFNGIDVPPGTVTTKNSFYNYREGKWVTMTEINMRKLAGYADGDPEGSPSFPNRLPANGLIYANQSDPGDGTQPGVRVTNAGRVDNAAGVTLVSPVPVYVQGDFNRDEKKPCAIIADAINILSNDWNDSNSNRAIVHRRAGNTVVNSAFIAGVDNTTVGNYNGGLENYPRFHENWSGRTLQYRGSFVSMWESQVATGPWSKSSYSPPIRDWMYDNDFLTGQLPPFTPRVVQTVTGAWWQQ